MVSHLSDCLQNDARLVIFMFPCVQSLQLYTIMQIGIFYADSGHEKIAHTKSVSRDFMATFVMNNKIHRTNPQRHIKDLRAEQRLCEADLIKTYLLLCLLAKMREE